MSYCRLGSDSDVYLYASFDGKYTIHLSNTSKVNPRETFILDTAQEVLDFLKQLRKDGVKVPSYALTRLRKEIKWEKENES